MVMGMYMAYSMINKQIEIKTKGLEDDTNEHLQKEEISTFTKLSNFFSGFLQVNFGNSVSFFLQRTIYKAFYDLIFFFILQ